MEAFESLKEVAPTAHGHPPQYSPQVYAAIASTRGVRYQTVNLTLEAPTRSTLRFPSPFPFPQPRDAINDQPIYETPDCLNGVIRSCRSYAKILRSACTPSSIATMVEPAGAPNYTWWSGPATFPNVLGQ